VPLEEARAFWMHEVRPRIVLADATRFEGEAYPGRYCYVATRWTRDAQDTGDASNAAPIVLVERYR
jgi:hypothetical protein